jgi:predicted DNA binding CopG/RHH family protein
MKRKSAGTSMPKDLAEAFDKGRRVPDFLPSPDKLVFKEETVKVTLALSKKSVEFFKIQAKAQKVPYQRMIKGLLDHYVERVEAG